MTCTLLLYADFCVPFCGGIFCGLLTTASVGHLSTPCHGLWDWTTDILHVHVCTTFPVYSFPYLDIKDKKIYHFYTQAHHVVFIHNAQSVKW